MTKVVQAVVGCLWTDTLSIASLCDLKGAQMKVQHSLIHEFIQQKQLKTFIILTVKHSWSQSSKKIVQEILIELQEPW